MGKHVQEEELNNKADKSIIINTGTGLEGGGGDLSTNRTIKLADAASPMTVSRVTSDMDYNDLKTPGFYENRAGTPPLNCPVNAAGFCTVMAIGSAILQEWRRRGSYEIYIRYSTDSGSFTSPNAGAWKKISSD